MLHLKTTFADPTFTRFSVSLFVFATIVIFAMPNKVFAWFEYFTSLVKIFIFLLLIVLSLALVLGAGPNGFIHHGDTWTRLPPFLNGFTVSLRKRKKTRKRGGKK